MASLFHSTRRVHKLFSGVSRSGFFLLLPLIYGAGSFGAESFNPVLYESQRQTIELNRSAVFQTTSDILEFRIADPQLCSAEVIGNDRKALSVTGLNRGATTLTVWFNRPTSTTQTYVIDVVTAPDTYKVLEEFIKQQFPKSAIKFTPVPTSPKVIVSGTASSCNEWQQIVQIISGSGVTYKDLIVRVTIPYCCNCCRR